MSIIIIAAVLIVSVLLGLWRLLENPGFQTNPLSRSAIVVGGIAALILLLMSGKLYALLIGLAALTPLLPFVMRLFQSSYYEQPVLDEIASPKPAGGMTSREALSILGLLEGASKEAIKSAHITMVQKVHPDQGGSDYLTQKVNEARDVLLGSAKVKK